MPEQTVHKVIIKPNPESIPAPLHPPSGFEEANQIKLGRMLQLK